MRQTNFLTSFLFCFALCLTNSVHVFAENLLDVVEAAQTTIEKRYSNKDSIARKLALEELEKIARSGKADDEIINAIMEKYPETSDELAVMADHNSNGIPDDWEKKFKVSPGFTAPDADEDADGFSLLQEYRAGTDPLDPRSHPKYITQLYVSAVSRQRFADLELLSVDTYASRNPSRWLAGFYVIRNGRKRVEYIPLGGTFRHNDTINFQVVDIVFSDYQNQKDPIVYIRRTDKAERIPCRPKEPVYDSVLQVKSLDSLNGRTFISLVGGTFKLGSERTGEETYRIVSADPDTKITVVESVGDKPETFKIPLVPSDLPAGKSYAKSVSAKSAASARTSEK